MSTLKQIGNPSIARVGDAAPTNKMIVAGVAETTVPTAVDDGDAVNVNLDEYGHQRIKGYSYAEDAVQTVLVADPMASTTIVTGITQLTAPGETASISVDGFVKYGYSFTVATIDTNVVVRLEGTIDDSNWYVMPLSNNVAPNMTTTNEQVTITANGTYLIETTYMAYNIRLDWVSETGGTAATIDADFMGRTK